MMAACQNAETYAAAYVSHLAFLFLQPSTDTLCAGLLLGRFRRHHLRTECFRGRHVKS